MPPAAGGPDSLEWQGRWIRRVGAKLVDENGTLAGSAITLLDAVRYVATALALPLESALTMATSTPARLLGLDGRIGRLAPGFEANLVHLTGALDVASVWTGGLRVEDGGA
jgi:N-acetylglucosamine-6-phosphate deacetylase